MYRSPLPSFLKSSISSSNLIKKPLLHKSQKKMNMPPISQSPMSQKLEINRKQRQIIINLNRLQLKIINQKIKRKLLQSKSPPNSQMPNMPQITQLRGKTQTKKLTLNNNRQLLQNKNSKISLPKLNSQPILLNKVISLHSKRLRRKKSLRQLKNMLILRLCLNLILPKKRQLEISKLEKMKIIIWNSQLRNNIQQTLNWMKLRPFSIISISRMKLL